MASCADVTLTINSVNSVIDFLAMAGRPELVDLGNESAEVDADWNAATKWEGREGN